MTRSGRPGDGFPGQSAAQEVDGVQADTCVRPYEARNVRRSPECPTHVQGFEVDGQVSNAVQLNLKSGEISPYRTYSASTLVPGQLRTSLDSTTFRIGQLSSGWSGWCWTVPATESDSLSSELGWGRAGRLAGCGDGVRRLWFSPCPARDSHPRLVALAMLPAVWEWGCSVGERAGWVTAVFMEGKPATG